MALWARGWFQDQHGFAVSGGGLNEWTAGRAADLLIGVKHDGDRAMSVLTRCGDCLESKNHHRDAGLHVVNPGTMGAAGVDAEGHGGERAHGPYGVEVSEKQEGLSRAAGEVRPEVVAGFLLLREGNPAADLLKLLRQERTHAVQGRLVIAGRLNLHHALEQRHHVRLSL